MTDDTPFDLEARDRVEKLIVFSTVFQAFRLSEARILRMCRIIAEPGEAKETAIREDRQFWFRSLCELSNYLGAVEMLRQHTIILKNRLYKHLPFAKEFREKAGEVFSAPEIRFLLDLRNYTVHYDIPGPGTYFSFDEGGYEITRLVIGGPEFLTWDKWEPASRKFIEQHGTFGIDVERVVLAYSAAVKRFYDWMSEKQMELHHDDLREYARQEAYIESIKRRMDDSVAAAAEDDIDTEG